MFLNSLALLMLAIYGLPSNVLTDAVSQDSTEQTSDSK